MPLLRFLPGVLPRQLLDDAYDGLRRAGMHYSNKRGYFSRTTGYLFDSQLGVCRQTEFTAREFRRWWTLLPLVRGVDSIYREAMPERYAVQRRHADASGPRWMIADTVFTTVTVNLWDAFHDARTPLHSDQRDLPDGFGVLTVLRSGKYKGGELVFPEQEVAVDLQTTDVLLFDPHEPHGNIAIEGAPGWERIACVFYFMADVESCVKTQQL